MIKIILKNETEIVGTLKHDISIIRQAFANYVSQNIKFFTFSFEESICTVEINSIMYISW